MHQNEWNAWGTNRSPAGNRGVWSVSRPWGSRKGACDACADSGAGRCPYCQHVALVFKQKQLLDPVSPQQNEPCAQPAPFVVPSLVDVVPCDGEDELLQLRLILTAPFYVQKSLAKGKTFMLQMSFVLFSDPAPCFSLDERQKWG